MTLISYSTAMLSRLLVKLRRWSRLLASSSFILLAVNSGNYQLQGYGLSSGSGTANSGNYQSHTTVGETSGQNMNGATYDANPGYISTIQANVTAAPTVTNVGESYNKLHLLLDDGGNPTDAKFAIAASPDGFSTTLYVQSDHTLGAVLGAEDWQTDTAWGSGGEFDVIGLTAATTYSFKVKATRGDFTESGWSAVGSAATVNPYLTFDLDIATTDAESAAPYTVAVGDLSAGAVTTAADLVWVDYATNGLFGGQVLVSASDSGLVSTSANHTITSASANLASGGVLEGFGLRANTVAQSSGGPLAANATYDVLSDNVGIINTTIRELLSSTGPVSGGRASFLVKAKASALTPSASDYQTTLTVIATAVF